MAASPHFNSAQHHLSTPEVVDMDTRNHSGLQASYRKTRSSSIPHSRPPPFHVQPFQHIQSCRSSLLNPSEFARITYLIYALANGR